MLQNRSRIISMDVSVTNLDQAVLYVMEKAFERIGAYVCVSNVHMCMETFDSKDFKDIVNSADLIVPDGRPIYWAQRLLGKKSASQVRGQDLMSELCNKSVDKGLKIGLYGGSDIDVLSKVKSKLTEEYPGIQIVYSYSPPFRPLTSAESQRIVNDLNEAEVDILFVGIGCPKQERWMAEKKIDVHCVMLGVGAAFDFISGKKNHAPRFMQYLGLEWLFRLVCEPKRLFKRYLIQNPRFIYHFCRQWLFRKEYS